MKNTDKRQTLCGYLEAKKDLDYWATKVAELEGLDLYRSPTVQLAPSGGGTGNPIEAAIIELETAREKKKEAEAVARDAMAKALELIEQAPTADQRYILRKKYIDGVEWDDMAREKGKSRTWATNLHGTALRFLEG